MAMADSKAEADQQQMEAESQEIKAGREALRKELTEAFHDLWHNALRALEMALPECRTPGSADARVYGPLRNQILNKGNGKVRDLDNVLRNYSVVQLRTRERVVVSVPEDRVMREVPNSRRLVSRYSVSQQRDTNQQT